MLAFSRKAWERRGVEQNYSQFLRVGDMEEVLGMWLQLHEGGLGQRRAPHQHDLVLRDTQVRHQLKTK